jgi:DNA repair protein RecO (recombination protein O)
VSVPFYFSQKKVKWNDKSMEYKYQAIILGKNDVAETNRIYTVYSKEMGKIRLLACGVRKPNAKLAGSLEPITFSEIFVAKGKGRGKITGVIALENFLSLKENIFALEKVFYVFKIFNRLISEEEKDERIFDLLLDYLLILEKDSLQKEDLKIEILTLGFIFKLLNALGYGMEMKKCVGCLKKLKAGENFFSAELGGVLCADCVKFKTKKIRISDESVKFIRIFLDNKIQNLAKIKTEKKNLENLKIIANEAVSWIVE